MKQASRQSMDAARQIIAHEAGSGQSPAELADAIEQVCQKLHGKLDDFIAPEGVRSLLARAMHLAEGEFPGLQGVTAEAQTPICFKGLHERV